MLEMTYIIKLREYMIYTWMDGWMDDMSDGNS